VIELRNLFDSLLHSIGQAALKVLIGLVVGMIGSTRFNDDISCCNLTSSADDNSTAESLL
jgi:hypothetical protein